MPSTTSLGRRIGSLVATVSLVAMLGAVARWGGGVSLDPAGPEKLPPDIEAACDTDNPYLVTACYVLPVGNIGREPAIVAFRDTPGDSPHYKLATQGQVGAIYGLAYSGAEHALYAAAFHKRQAAFGPDGPGAIYRIDLTSGDIAQWAVVPNAGDDRHGVSLQGGDRQAEAWAGKTSLGDIDLSAAGSELFVTNLFDRRIYRFAIPSGDLLGSFAHGASAEDWSAEARPFGLAAHGGRLYHGVVRSAEATRRATDLTAYVYSSAEDGTDLHEVAAFALDYRRGTLNGPAIGEVRLDWLAWNDRPSNIAQRSRFGRAHPMPILSDLDFDENGNMIIGLRDRLLDMSVMIGAPEDYYGVGAGDTLRGTQDGERWTVSPIPEHFADSIFDGDESTMGAVAALPWLGQVVANGFDIGIGAAATAGETTAFWFEASGGGRLRQEGVCLRFGPQPRTSRLHRVFGAPIALADDEGAPGGTTGDIEVLCAPAMKPSPTPPPTATATAEPSSTVTPSPTRSPTRSPTPASSATPTPTSTPTATPVPRPLYLPLLLRERCTPDKQRADVALVIDASSSMLEETTAGRTKLAAAIEAAGTFLDHLQLEAGDQAAVVAFNADATLLQPLAADRAALDDALAGIQPALQTCLVCGVDVAAVELASERRNPDNTPVMIVLTDGLSNPRPASEAVAQTDKAKQTGIVIFTIGLGDTLDFEALSQMASKPEYFHRAPDAEDLAYIYRRIAVEIPCPNEEFWGGR